MILLWSVPGVTVKSLGPIQQQAKSAKKDRIEAAYAESDWEALRAGILYVSLCPSTSYFPLVFLSSPLLLLSPPPKTFISPPCSPLLHYSPLHSAFFYPLYPFLLCFLPPFSPFILSISSLACTLKSPPFFPDFSGVAADARVLFYSACSHDTYLLPVSLLPVL